MSFQTPYTNATLDSQSTSIRLLEYLPGPHSLSKPRIRFKFHVVSLADAPAFIALSYRWGDHARQKKILLEGFHVAIRQNLYKALEAIQKRRKDWPLFTKSERTFFWMDVLCINQEDIGERNHQVQLMKQIYSKASFVLIWLGIQSDNSETIIRNAMAGATGDSDSASALVSLLSRTYWKRLWVVQEVLLAQSIYLLCGDDLITWDALRKYIDTYSLDSDINLSKSVAAKSYSGFERQDIGELKRLTDNTPWMQQNQRARQDINGRRGLTESMPWTQQNQRWRAQYDTLKEIPLWKIPEIGIAQTRQAQWRGINRLNPEVLEALKGSPGVDLIRAKAWWNPNHAFLHKAIIRWAKRECNDPRDKVFALFGIVANDKDPLLKSLVVDYSMSVDALYEKLLRDLVRAEQSWIEAEYGTFLPADERTNLMEELLTILGVKLKFWKVVKDPNDDKDKVVLVVNEPIHEAREFFKSSKLMGPRDKEATALRSFRPTGESSEMWQATYAAHEEKSEALDDLFDVIIEQPPNRVESDLYLFGDIEL